MSSSKAPKPQKISLGLSVAIGLASMLGAGVFVVFHEAEKLTSQVSDHWGLLIAIGLAGIVAILNAASVYQLAKVVSRAGGVYSYSRVYVGPTTSFVAGFSFVFGKIASIAAIGLVFGVYVWPEQPVLASSLAIAALTAINLLGINRTARVALLLSIATVSFLVVTLVWGFTRGAEALPVGAVVASDDTLDHTLGSVVNFVGTGSTMPILSAASIVFFAFAGYARVATLGDEVHEPRRNIPRAIAISLSAVLVIYFALAVMFQNTLGDALAEAPAPFVTFWQNSTTEFGLSTNTVQNIVLIFAAAASLGSLLALLAGVSRTAATMAEDHELPAWFSARNRHAAPWLAEVVVAFGAIILAQFGRLDWVIGFSSLSVLLYYAIGHYSALRQPTDERVMGRWVGFVGIFFCVLLLLAVPGPAVWLSALILGAALLIRRVARLQPQR